MFAGGDKKADVIAREIVFNCGGAFKPNFNPDTDGEEDCRTAARERIEAATEDLKTADEWQRFEEGQCRGLNHKYYVCREQSGVDLDAKKKKDAGTINAKQWKAAVKKFQDATKCMADFAAGTTTFELSDSDDQPSTTRTYATNDAYLQRIAEIAKDKSRMPENLRIYLDSISSDYPVRSNYHPNLAKKARALFFEAKSKVDSADWTNAEQEIADQIMEWAMQKEGDLANPEKEAATEEEIHMTYVKGVGAAPGYEVKFGVAGSESKGDGGSAEISVRIGRIDGETSVKGSASATIPFAQTEDGEVKGVINIGLEGGHTPSEYDRLPGEPYQKLPAEDLTGAVTNLNVGIVSEPENANYTTTFTLGWNGDAATGLTSILGLGVKGEIYPYLDLFSPNADDKKKGKITIAGALGTPHQWATYEGTPDLNFGNQAGQIEGGYTALVKKGLTLSGMLGYRLTRGDDPTKHDILAGFTPAYTPNPEAKKNDQWNIKAALTGNYTATEIDTWRLKLAPTVTTPSFLDSDAYTLTANFSPALNWLSDSTAIAASRSVDGGFEAVSIPGQIDFLNASKKSSVDLMAGFCYGWGGGNYSACGDFGRILIDKQDDKNTYGVTVIGKF